MPDNTLIQLHGFNNLTKSLSFNIYTICYARSDAQQRSYQQHIKAFYCASRLTKILGQLAGYIGATVLHVSTQDYEPHGASAALLIAEGPMLPKISSAPLMQHAAETVLAHLDKSHITVHTYPEAHSVDGINTLRIDVDVATCGEVSPLAALDFLLSEFDPDVVTIDYRVRGFTRDTRGHKHFMDHDLQSIQDFIPTDSRPRYEMRDVNLAAENIFHTRLMRRNTELQEHLCDSTPVRLTELARQELGQRISQEKREIFSGNSDTS